MQMWISTTESWKWMLTVKENLKPKITNKTMTSWAPIWNQHMDVSNLNTIVESF